MNSIIIAFWHPAACMSCNTGAMYEYTTSKQKKLLATTSKPLFFFNFVGMKIKIEIEIEIASFCEDCRKDQDCLLLGNLLQ